MKFLPYFVYLVLGGDISPYFEACHNITSSEKGICISDYSCLLIARGTIIGSCVNAESSDVCCKIKYFKSTVNESKIQSSAANSTAVDSSSEALTPCTEKEAKDILFQNRFASGESSENNSRCFTEDSHLRSWSMYPVPQVYGKPVSLERDHDMRKPVEVAHDVDLRRPVVTEESHDLRRPVEVAHDFDLRRPVEVAPDFDLRRPVMLEQSHNRQKPVEIAHDIDLRHPVILQESHDLRKPVEVTPEFNLRRPVMLGESYNLRKTVEVAHDFDLRRPVMFEESHDLRWPVMEEDSHDLRRSVINYSEIHQATLGESEETSESPRSSSHVEILLRKIGYNFGNLFMEDDEILMDIFKCLEWMQSEQKSRSNEMFDASSEVCGINRVQTTARLIGGTNSEYMQWPWIVSLRQRYRKRFYHKCGATLMNNLWVVTAAHCVQWEFTYSFILRLGQHNLKHDDEPHSYVERSLKRILIHPKFNSTSLENDIALLQMDALVEFQPNIIPVCLPKNVGSVEGRTGTVVGWGKRTESSGLSRSLRELRLPILSNHECEDMYAKIGPSEKIYDSLLCAGTSEGGFDACDGDSGGPMVILDSDGRWSLIGIVSWGKECAAPNQPGVYTRITSFIEWMEETMMCYK